MCQLAVVPAFNNPRIFTLLFAAAAAADGVGGGGVWIKHTILFEFLIKDSPIFNSLYVGRE